MNQTTKQFKNYTESRQYQGERRSVPIAKRITIPAESKEHYQVAAEIFAQLSRDMHKALRLKTSFTVTKLAMDHLINQAGQDLKHSANKNAKSFHYKGAI